MITGIILLAVIAFVGVISYRRPKLEQRVFKNVPLIDWLYILVIPTAAYIGITLITRSIIFRDPVEILDFNDFFLLSFGIFLLMYAAVGTSIHFVGKVLSRYIPYNRHSLIYRVNEVFHGKLSHYMIYVCALLMMFVLSLLEINHPLPENLPALAIRVIVLAGIVFGISSSKIIFWTHAWFGGYNKPLFLLTCFLLVVLLTIIEGYRLDISYYPVNLFFTLMFASLLGAFLVRQLLIFTRLNSKKRLRFLSRLLSA